MSFVRFAILVSIACLFAHCDFAAPAQAEDEGPRSTDPRLKIQLFAEAPQIVTPTGIDVDSSGRVWAIESNTHFPPEGYPGHPTDRILVMEDTDRDGKADKIIVFKDGLTHSMSIAVKPVWLDPAAVQANSELGTAGDKKSTSPREVYIATRREIFLAKDTDGDLKCNDITSLVHLETSGNYPHNGLAGFAFDAAGNMYFGFGENLGADYKIIGSDGTTLSGGGEGGNIYRCRPDGTKLQRWATGFWNPHASCFDASGRLFTLDNDPDSRPPCRLLQIIQDGDYGYRFRNGRKGTHPFTSWNGEIPGTLPMVSGTGEAPSGIVCYESDGFPTDYRGTLLVGSWGDHRIDQFRLKPRGISFESVPQPLIKGNENFRPVGLAVAPDGAIYVTDWVSKEYKLHGLGRIWRISAKDEPQRPVVSLDDIQRESSAEVLVHLLESPILNVRRLAAKRLAKFEDAGKVLKSRKPSTDVAQSSRIAHELFSAGLTLKPVNQDIRIPFENVDLSDPFQLTETTNLIISQATSPEDLKQHLVKAQEIDSANSRNQSAELRQIAILLAARSRFPQDASFAQEALTSPYPSIRRLAVQWVGEEKLAALRPAMETVLASEPMTTELFMACLASLSLLDGVPPAQFERTPPAQYILGIVNDAARPAALRAIALRMLAPAQKELDARLLGEMLASKDASLRREVVRTLQHSPIPEREELLRGMAADESLDVNLRADAIAGLGGSHPQSKLNPASRDLLIKLASGDTPIAIRLEAIRSLRGTSTGKQTSPHRDAEVTEALKQIASSLSKVPESLRPKLSAAVAFAVGTYTPVDPGQLLGDVASTKGAAQVTGPQQTESEESGRRTFFHANGAGCFKCHTVGGRGGQVGPDLTVIARTMDRKKLAESILEPNKEISPQFTTWAVETTGGKVVTGMLLGEEVNGDLRLGNNLGEVVFVPFKEIETRTPLKTSIMPEKLHEAMTADEFRDLIAFLASLK